MTSRPNVPAIFPPASSIIRSAASLRRVPWGEFPDLTGSIRRLRLLAPRRASPRLLRSALPSLRPPEPDDSPEPGPLLSRRPRRPIAMEKTRYPRFLGDPCIHAPLSDPGEPPNPGHYRSCDVVFRPVNNVDFALGAFEALSRGLHALCVRFAAGAAPEPRHTRFRLGASVDRSGLTPAGSHRRFPSCLSLYMASSFTKLCLAQEPITDAVHGHLVVERRSVRVHRYRGGFRRPAGGRGVHSIAYSTTTDSTAKKETHTVNVSCSLFPSTSDA